MICNESQGLELYENSYAEYIESKSGCEEVTYTELQPLQTSSLFDSPRNDKENDITFLNPLSPVYVGASDRPSNTSFFSLASLQDDGFIAKLASIDKTPTSSIQAPKQRYEYSNDGSNDSFNSNEYSLNIDPISTAGHSSVDYNDLPEVNTKDIAERVLKELRKHNIAQHVFARKVLHRSQGTLSDLLRNPKPWAKMKNGRETFHKLLTWLQQDEQQRISMLA